jgi:YHS domain-containing protein
MFVNAVQRLRQTDFSKIAAMEVSLLEGIAEKLWREMAKRMKRRLKTAPRNEKLDLRNTIRASLQHGGDPIELVFKGRKPKKIRLVMLLDVSGSMDKYSFFLLRFICALQSYFEKVESFIFSTELRRITDFLATKGLEDTLKLLSQKADNWSSGTKIGLCLKEFNEKYAKTMLYEQALKTALSVNCRYVSFITSRKKKESVYQNLKQFGLTEAQLSVIRAPAGLDIHAKTPEEVAISILAEIIQVFRTQEVPKNGFEKPKSKPQMITNPVCGMPISAGMAKYTLERDGQLVYFCCDGCKIKFDEDPDKYRANFKTDKPNDSGM